MNTERIQGLVIIVLAIMIAFVLIPAGIVSPSNLEHISTAPHFWPMIISGGLGLTGALMVVFAKNGVAADTESSNADEPNTESETLWIQRMPRLLFVFGILFGFYFAIPYLGMVVPGILLILGLMAYAGQRRWGLMLGLSVGVPLLLYAFFVYVAQIPIPLGWFEILRG